MKKLVIKKIKLQSYDDGLVCYSEIELIQPSDIIIDGEDVNELFNESNISWSEEFEGMKYQDGTNAGSGDYMYSYWDSETGIIEFSKELDESKLGK